MSGKQKIKDHSNAARLEINASLNKMINAKGGLKAFAAKMIGPAKTSIDLEAVMRKLYVLEKNWPKEYKFFYDTDLPRTPAIKTTDGPGTYIVDMAPLRVEINDGQITSTTYVKRSDLYTNAYDVYDRAKERVAEGMRIREDLILMNLAHVAANSTLGNPNPTTAGMLSKAVLSKAYQYIEDQNLNVNATVIRPSGSKGLRNITRDNMDDKGMEELRQSGELGVLWGASFVKSVLLNTGTALTFAEPEYVGHYFVRADMIIDVDESRIADQKIGFVGFHMYGASIHNAKGVVESQYNESA